MRPDRLTAFMEKRGMMETQAKGQVFHAQDFTETLFMLKKGYVKRYQLKKDDQRIIELIYGPGHIFPLSQLYKKLFGVEQNQEDLVYVYQAMTEIEIQRVNDDDVVAELEKDPTLFKDLYYEAGLRLKSNIDRLASNALKDDYMKVAHQLVCLADEFGSPAEYQGKPAVRISVPLEPVDMAEQLNISTEVAEAVMISLSRKNLIAVPDKHILIFDVAPLKDIYL
jgi:CRP-like cAMP-binding protein